MKDSTRKTRDIALPDHVASSFTQDLLDEISRDHYSLRSWRRLMSRSWKRSLDDIKASPARTRSCWWWAAAGSVPGFGVVLLAWLFHSPKFAIGALTLWLPWFSASVFFVLTHLGMADDDRGAPHRSLLLPNGISFLRLALAPLVLTPFLNTPIHPLTGLVFAVFLVGMSVSDVLDGWIARRRNICTRLGGMLDILADLAFLTFLAVGLYQVDAIPGSLMWLLVVRYPFMLIGALVLYFARGPISLSPTIIGKATTFATSVVLLVIAVRLLGETAWPPSLWIDWSVWSLNLLVGTNILYLLYRGFIWAGSRNTAGETTNV